MLVSGSILPPVAPCFEFKCSLNILVRGKVQYRPQRIEIQRQNPSYVQLTHVQRTPKIGDLGLMALI